MAWNIYINAVEHQMAKIAKLTGRKGTKRGRVRAKSTADRVKKWKGHFSRLLGHPPFASIKPTVTVIQETLLIITENITMDELLKCIKEIKNNKVSGLDNILTEVWCIEPTIAR